MKQLLFMLESLFRQQEDAQCEGDYLGFEAYTRPTETNESLKLPFTAETDEKRVPKAA